MFNLVVVRFLLGITNLCNSGIVAILPFSNIVENNSQGNSSSPVSYRICEQYPMDYIRCPNLSKSPPKLDFTTAGFYSFITLICDSVWMFTAVVEIYVYVLEKKRMKLWYGLQITISSIGLTFAIGATFSFYTSKLIEYNYRQALAFICSILSRVILNCMSWTMLTKNRRCRTSENNAIERPNNASLELQVLPRTEMLSAGRREHNNFMNAENNTMKYLNERRQLQMKTLPPPVPERGASLKDNSVQRSKAVNDTNRSKALKLRDVEPIAGTSNAAQVSNEESLTRLTEQCDDYTYIESEETAQVAMDDVNNNDNEAAISVAPPAIPERVASLRDGFTSFGKRTAVASNQSSISAASNPDLNNSIYAPHAFVASASVHTKKISKHEEHTNANGSSGNKNNTLIRTVTRIHVANDGNNKIDFFEFPPPPSMESIHAGTNIDMLGTVYEDVELGLKSQVEGPKGNNMYDAYYEPVTEL